MNQELRELYQEVIIEHSRTPHHFGALAAATHSAEGYNPLCGDKIKIYLQVTNDQISNVSFEGTGCAISQASASLMTDILIGKPVENALVIFEQFHDAMLAPAEQVIDPVKLGKLTVLGGVREFPMRIKCATLAWHTMKNALSCEATVANTEEGEQ